MNTIRSLWVRRPLDLDDECSESSFSEWYILPEVERVCFEVSEGVGLGVGVSWGCVGQVAGQLHAVMEEVML